MYSRFAKICSIVLVMVMLFNLLPHEAIALDLNTTRQSTITNADNLADEEMSADESADIVAEIIENRTKFTKEYQMSNGLHMAVVYPEAVHYEENGQWKDIDNTLKAVGTGSMGKYTNTAGAWEAVFPQQLNKNNQVSITKDGYAVSFGMAGELRKEDNQAVESSLFGMRMGGGTTASASMTVEPMKASAAQIQKVDYTEVKELAEHPEIIRDKLQSQLIYSDVYDNTDIIYDLSSYQLKESIEIASFDPTVQGYRYTLEVGALTPVLNSDGSINFMAPDSNEIIMTMPAPYMIDAAGATDMNVAVTLVPNGTAYTLTYAMPMDWLADADRQWPVVLDPAIEAESDVINLKDRVISQRNTTSYTYGALICGYANDTKGNYGITQSFIKYADIPNLSSADVIINARISLLYRGGSNSTTTIEAHKVLGPWESETITWTNAPSFDTRIAEDYAQVYYDPTDYENANESEFTKASRYTWEITDIVREWYSNNNYGLMFKASDSIEKAQVNNWKKFYSSDFDASRPELCPYLTITFRNGNGLEDYWDYTASSTGRAGTGYVNNYSGNLTWVHSDIGFGGNRMPVTISHVYNANDCAQNFFGLGYGWRTNFNQTVSIWNKDNTYYVWEDGDGTKHYFKNESAGTYKDEDGLELTLTVSGSNKTITDKNNNTSHFDSEGRLVKLENYQATKSNITITYQNSTSKLISKITDGAGRVYNFTYTDGLLSRISYVGTGTTELAYVSFGYEGSRLTTITDKDGKVSQYTCDSCNYLTSAQDTDGYRLQYTYSTGTPKRVVGISEWDGTIAGGSMTIEYAHNQTTFTDHDNNVQLKQFNDWGNLVSVQDGQGRAQYGQYARTDYNDNTSKSNRLLRSSKLQNTVSNLLKNPSFEDGSSMWSLNSSTVTMSGASDIRYSGNYSMKLVATTESTRYGAYSSQCTVEPGRTVTFSAYVKTADASVALAFERSTNYYIIDGVVVPENTNWNRYQMSYTNTSTVTEYFRCYFFVRDPGTVYVDCVQLETEATASRFNLINNGNFIYDSYIWYPDTGITFAGEHVTANTAVPKLNNTVYSITGDPSAAKIVTQAVPGSGSAGDCFVLSGWAKAESVPITNSSRAFGIWLVFHHSDGGSSTHKLEFNSTHGHWQYGAMPIVAYADYYHITVKLVYNYNANTAYFDGIQLFKEEFGTSFTYDEKGNIISAVDQQKQRTEYEYTDNNLTKIIQAGNTQMTYTYDDHHNVKTATTGNGVVYRFEYDTYGNNTQVSIVSGDQEITTKARYSEDGNRLEYVLDTLDNKTKYCYNKDTNVLEWVEYPNDTETTRTEYTYDEMFRLATAAADVNTGYTLTASYTYADDQLTAIETGSTTYGFTYGDFAQRTGVKVGNHTLATYTYTPDKNRYLSQLTYGNDDRIQYAYDKYGRVIKETYEDGASVTYAYDNTGNLATVTDSETGIKFTYYYDLTNRLAKYTEEGNGYSHQITYTYDGKNNLVSTTESSNGRVNPLGYTYDTNNRLTKLTYGAGGKTYTYDAYGRLTQRGSIYFANTNIRENITYKAFSTGDTTNQIATWQNVSATYNVTYSYTYDDNGNITAISDGTNTTSYVYDSANQLVRENNQAGGFTKTWTYDDAGNILSRGEYAYTTGALGTPTDTVTYTYGDANWGDKLTAYDGNTITYDGVGNPLNDGTWTYTWKHGRQLVSMTDGTTTVAYTYNADGMRIGKTVTRSNYSETHKYFYDNGKLTYDIVTVVDNGVTTTHDLLMSYDESGRPMMITYDHVSYYYLLNAQGDVVAITTVGGELMAAYTYDAWGNVLSITGPMADTMGQWNQLRYRGYAYDQETGLYYLQSRYYNPETGRFINEDSTAYLGADGTLIGYNLYAYSANNPVVRVDPTGHFGLVGAIIVTGAIVGGLLGAFTAATTGGNVIESAIEGCLTGALGATCGILIPNFLVAVGLATVGGAAIDFTTQVASQLIETKHVDMSKIDGGRIAKTALQTGIGTAVPSLGEGAGNAVDAFGTALTWAEASTLIACADIAVTNTISAVQSSSKRSIRTRHCVVLDERKMLVR